MCGFFWSIWNVLQSEDGLWQAALWVVAGYYFLAWMFIHAERTGKRKGIWWLFKKRGLLDIVTAFLWFILAVALIFSMIHLASSGRLELRLLLIYYASFMFLFAFIYSLLEWHYAGSFVGVSEVEKTSHGSGLQQSENRQYEFTGCWKDEFMYFMISLQTQTTLGYNRARPNRWYTDLLTGIQALVTLFLVTVAIAEAVGLSQQQ